MSLDRELKFHIRSTVKQKCVAVDQSPKQILGSLGAVPGWPGEQTWPPQPMLTQTRAVLNGYAVAGGKYREAVIEDAGHGPHLDQPEQFLADLTSHLSGT